MVATQKIQVGLIHAGKIVTVTAGDQSFELAAGSRWLLPLLSAAGPVPHLRGLPGAVTAPCPAQRPALDMFRLS
jgi:hypothetical protein